MENIIDTLEEVMPEPYHVYVQTDGQGRITAVNSSAFVPDDWGTEIDQGYGDKYHHAQGNYFPNGLYTEDSLPRYKLVDGKPIERTVEEIEDDRLPHAKAAKIAKSKSDLASYLVAHPLLWTDGEYYSITAEKQAQLTGKVMAATMAATLSQPYTLTWNSTGEVCKEWELTDLSALAFAIDARVTALVTYQQTQEVAINTAQTMAELESIVVDYDEV